MIELRSFTLGDAPRLIEWAISPQFLLQWVGPTFEYPLDLGQIERHLQRAAGSEPAILPFKAVDPSSGEMLGYIELCDIDRKHRNAMVGRVIVGSERRRGRGTGTRMVQEVLRIGFEELRLHRIALVVFDFNEAAIACYRKAGFQIEGRLRESRRMGDEFWTLYSMSILESEWCEACRLRPAAPVSLVSE